MPCEATVVASGNILLQRVVGGAKASNTTAVISTNSTRKSDANADSVLRGHERASSSELAKPPRSKSKSMLKMLQNVPRVCFPPVRALLMKKRVDQLTPPVVPRVPIGDPGGGRGRSVDRPREGDGTMIRQTSIGQDMTRVLGKNLIGRVMRRIEAIKINRTLTLELSHVGLS